MAEDEVKLQEAGAAQPFVEALCDAHTELSFKGERAASYTIAMNPGHPALPFIRRINEKNQADEPLQLMGFVIVIDDVLLGRDQWELRRKADAHSDRA